MDSSNKSPLVSVVVPTYNRADFIGSTIDSILNQTYENIELIVVSDGSKDNTYSVLSQYEEKDKRVTFVSLAQNTGIPAKVRNTGIKRAKGKYIAFCDDDDIWVETKLATQIEALENQNAIISFTDIVLFDDEKEYNVKPFSRLIAKTSNYLIQMGFKSILLFGSHIVNSSVLIRKDVIKEVGYLNEDKNLRASEDYEYWLRIVPKRKVCYISKQLVKYRIHHSQISVNKLTGYTRCYRILSEVKGYPPLSRNLAKLFIHYRIKQH